MESTCRQICVGYGCVLLFLTSAGSSFAAAEDIEVNGCFLTLKEQAQIPARDAGLIREILVQPGDTVDRSQVLALLEDEDARLALQQAKLDLAVEQKKRTDAVLVEIAAAAAEEAGQLLHQARLAEQVSRKTANTDILIRQAAAAGVVAQDAFDRASESRKAFPGSMLCG